MPRQAAALEDAYVQGMYGAGRERQESRARFPFTINHRRQSSQSPPPGFHSPSRGRRQEDRHVDGDHGSSRTPVTHVRAIGDGHRPKEVSSMEEYEDMGLVELFRESCPGWAVPKEFMTNALNKLSHHHPGHIRSDAVGGDRHGPPLAGIPA